ncbi:hypothetical protein RB620_24580 [Paenibacillus sp. LHD-117]|uniref:hypothetical protein n=1 Tax=Paenibacillus sp. LHD-117 TaxID=3071412 RepID=UPI0027E1A710|nr:hypothetical protein [Paenibacillus sp. LHD-117]MDQ6422613.1 hypothetical protein [Paenibacillus sp. LHD-117]
MNNIFIELQNEKAISLSAVRCVVKDGEQIVIVTIKGMQDAVWNEVEYETIKDLLVKKYNFSAVEVVGGTLDSRLIQDNGAPYPALVNMNQITMLSGGWMPEFHYADGTRVGHAGSYGGMELGLKPAYLKIEVGTKDNYDPDAPMTLREKAELQERINRMSIERALNRGKSSS